MRSASACAPGAMRPATAFVVRASERLPIRLDAGLSLAQRRRSPVRLRDISQLGFMAECADFVAIGSSVWLDCGAADRFEADIRWALVGWFGGRFATPLDARQLARLLDAACTASVLEFGCGRDASGKRLGRLS